jgi:hypothetical protein
MGTPAAAASGQLIDNGAMQLKRYLPVLALGISAFSQTPAASSTQRSLWSAHFS